MEHSDSELEDNDLSGLYSDDEILSLVALGGSRLKPGSSRAVINNVKQLAASTPAPQDTTDWIETIKNADIVFAENCSVDIIHADIPEQDISNKDNETEPSIGQATQDTTFPGERPPSSTIDEVEEEDPVPNQDIGGDIVLGSEDEAVGLQDNRKRRYKNRSAPHEWKQNLNKKLRMMGKPYVGFSKPAGGKSQHDTNREARKQGVTCKSTACQKSKVRFCQGFSETIRQEIFKKFWEQMNWDQRKTFVTSHVDYLPTKKKTGNGGDSRRSGSYFYSLHLIDEKKSVCQTMFLNTLGIGKWSVQNWAKEEHGMSISSETLNESRRAERRKSTIPQQRKFAQDFLNSLAKLPSHYCRRDSSKLYLEPGLFQSKQDLFREYENKCKELDLPPLSRFTFSEMVVDAHISIFLPKKDKCDTCCEHEVGNLGDEDWENHIKKKDRARREKVEDKEAALNGECHLATMDLQAVKMAPYLKASALYYKTKLCVHNFTVFDLGTKDATNYIWHEAEAELVASAFASCVIHYITKHYKDGLPIVLFSDGCTYQNRNSIMSNALLHYSVNNNTTITQKFLEKGHTQMECDSVHAALEKKLKNREIYLPTDYIAVSNEARTTSNNRGPYVTEYLDHTFFVNYTAKATMAYDSIRPGRVAHDPTVTQLRAIRYNPNGTINVKLNFDDDWEDLPRRPKQISKGVVFPRLYNGQLKIPTRKWEHLQQLKSVLPAHCHSFYDNLKKE